MIAIYRGKSVVSRIIRAINWSQYSHVAWVDDIDGTVIEAWHIGGVAHVKTPSSNHTPGTAVDLFIVLDEEPHHTAMIREFLMAQVGKKYDFAGILGFIFRATHLQRKQKWFCSELVAEAYATAGLPLLRIPSHKIYPGMLAGSPMLKHSGGFVTS
jgi:uncharacterized protein YycO